MRLDTYLLKCNEIYHTTLDPKGPGVLRIHLIPPKKLKAGIPWVVIINGYYVLPLQTTYAILLKIFIEHVNQTNGNPYDSLDEIIDGAVTDIKKVFDKTEKDKIRVDLKDIVLTLTNIARGKNPNINTGFTSIAEYSRFMSAPHRMDLMISSMKKNDIWNCNQKCAYCYAKDEVMSAVSELSKEEWIKVIDKLREAHIPQLTFTGGEPTLRPDLVELIDHSKWFVTRLNTNGILLSKELCRDLYNASLDSVQITFYSSNEAIHNLLVGGNHYNDTLNGIKNALEAGLDVSINTPLSSINKNYLETVKFLSDLGIKYFTCSGLIPSGGATTSESISSMLSKDEITSIVKEAYNYLKEKECELSFTSPGWIDEKTLNEMNMIAPSCGASMSNMAIAPNGIVLPCQSWLFEDGLGNILDTDWNKIWNSKKCKKRRKLSAKNEHVCPLKEEALK